MVNRRHVADHRQRVLRAALLPAVDPHRLRRAGRRRDRRRPDRAVRRVRRAGADGGVGDERRRLRLDDERLLQAAARQALRRGAGDAAAARRRGARRDRLGRRARLRLLDRLPRDDVGAGDGRVAVDACWRCRSACSSASPSPRSAWPARRTCARGPTSSTSARSPCRCSCSRRRSTRCRATATGRGWSSSARCTTAWRWCGRATSASSTSAMLGHVAVLVALAAVGIVVASRRIGSLLLT